jgi:hypothetical protein
MHCGLSRKLAATALMTSLCFGIVLMGGAGEGKKAKKERNNVQVDLNKLPPGIAKQVVAEVEVKEEKKGKKKDGKSAASDVSLIDAIKAAERLNKGSAFKADRKGEPGEYRFKVDLVDRQGVKTKVTLDNAGKVVDQEQKKAPDKK